MVCEQPKLSAKSCNSIMRSREIEIGTNGHDSMRIDAGVTLLWEHTHMEGEREREGGEGGEVHTSDGFNTLLPGNGAQCEES